MIKYLTHQQNKVDSSHITRFFNIIWLLHTILIYPGINLPVKRIAKDLTVRYSHTCTRTYSNLKWPNTLFNSLLTTPIIAFTLRDHTGELYSAAFEWFLHHCWIVCRNLDSWYYVKHCQLMFDILKA